MKNIVIALVVLVIIVGLGYMFFAGEAPEIADYTQGTPSTSTPSTGGATTNNPGSVGGNTPTTSGSKTIEGTFICLPHKDTTGPQTMECAYGIKAADGSNYALDLSSVSGASTNLPINGKKFSVVGTVTTVEALSSNTWQNYDIKGIIKVLSYKEVATTPAPTLTNSQVSLKLNESFSYLGNTIKVWAVTEDSRCPSDVTCVQAGRVRIALYVTTPSGGPSTSSELEIGKFITTPNITISLDKVNPYPVSTKKTTDGEYSFVFTIKAR